MPTYQLDINGKSTSFDAEEDMPLLWALRDLLDLKGTKFGCGIAQCGACTVMVEGTAARSCSLPVSALEGKKITTIEGLSTDGDHPVQKAWVEHDVPQCGYCQAGQIMSAAALLDDNPQPSEAEIKRAMQGNICRCGTYPRILKAIQSASKNGILSKK